MLGLTAGNRFCEGDDGTPEAPPPNDKRGLGPRQNATNTTPVANTFVGTNVTNDYPGESPDDGSLIAVSPMVEEITVMQNGTNMAPKGTSGLVRSHCKFDGYLGLTQVGFLSTEAWLQ